MAQADQPRATVTTSPRDFLFLGVFWEFGASSEAVLMRWSTRYFGGVISIEIGREQIARFGLEQTRRRLGREQGDRGRFGRGEQHQVLTAAFLVFTAGSSLNVRRSWAPSGHTLARVAAKRKLETAVGVSGDAVLVDLGPRGAPSR